MSANAEFDHWYAVQKTRIIVSPRHRLETFGNTLVHYHLISELDDYPGKVRVREGRLEAHKPLVITPDFSDVEVEGFGEEARAYIEFLRHTEEHMRILRYGYQLKSDNFSESVVTDSIRTVTDRVRREVESRGGAFSAVLQGVDDPWDVALVELWRREVERSARTNIEELQRNGRLF
ncbi:MAG: hypothetical protein J5807_00285 [Kiritimatiellae bacterium]|nr:hypothetical protein [Kiritimatiellia bacterium]